MGNIAGVAPTPSAAADWQFLEGGLARVAFLLPAAALPLAACERPPCRRAARSRLRGSQQVGACHCLQACNWQLAKTYTCKACVSWHQMATISSPPVGTLSGYTPCRAVEPVWAEPVGPVVVLSAVATLAACNRTVCRTARVASQRVGGCECCPAGWVCIVPNLT